MEERLPSLQTGDILLMRNPHGRFNPGYQRMRRSGRLPSEVNDEFIPTHAALLLDHNVVIHSNKIAAAADDSAKRMKFKQALELAWTFVRRGRDEVVRHPTYPALIEAKRQVFGRGVDVEAIRTVVEAEDSKDLMLVRHPAFGESLNPELFLKLLNEGLYHLDKPYNVFIELYDGGNAAAFCSQLVYDVLNGIVPLPKKNGNSVLPVDFLLWANEFGWRKFTGEFVKAAVEQIALAQRDHDPVLSSAQLHRYMVKSVRDTQNTMHALNEFERMVARFIDAQGEQHLPPARWMDFGLEPAPLSAEGAINAADEICKFTTGLDHAKDERRTDLELEPAIGKLEGPRSWQIAPKLDEPEVGDSPPGVKIAYNFLDHTVRLLDDFDECLGSLVAALEDGVSFESNPEPLERFCFVARFFTIPSEIEKIDKDIKRASTRLDALSSHATATTQHVIEAAVQPGFDANSPQSRKIIASAIQSAINDHFCSINYAVAMDFCQTVALLHTLRGDALLKESLLSIAGRNPREVAKILKAQHGGKPFRSAQQETFEKVTASLTKIFAR